MLENRAEFMNEQLAVFFDFENIAIWAGQEFFDLNITQIMEYLKSRGPVAIKRAYADWSRFPAYRDEMVDNAIDLIQLYSVRSGKNLADIRLAVDAFETAMQHRQIGTFVILSGDSDFCPLVAKLREWGKYVLGIGPRNITHPSLVKACDEFIYLETLFGTAAESGAQSGSEREEARQLLQRALLAHGKRGGVPVLAAKLKQTMLSMEPTFNELDFGYSQFRAWLEDNRDMVQLYFKDLQLYVAPADFKEPAKLEAFPGNGGAVTNGGHLVKHVPDSSATPVLATQYAQLFKKIVSVDMQTRRDVLRDIYRELCQRPGERSTNDLLEELRQIYEAQGLTRSKTTLMQIWKLGFRQGAYDYMGNPVSFQSPVQLAEDIDSETLFIRRCESGFVYAALREGLPLDQAEMAAILFNERGQSEYIETLLKDLEQRHVIVCREGHYQPVAKGTVQFKDDPYLQPVIRDVTSMRLPENLSRGAEAAGELASKAQLLRSEDFTAAMQNYLLACRLQWDAFKDGEPNASLEDLRWYLASYASTKAGTLSQTRRDYDNAIPYYLAFFSMVQEDDPLWERMRNLINPMLFYYWMNLARKIGITVTQSKSPARVAVELACHSNEELRGAWQEATRRLAQVNPGLLHRIVEQIRLNQAEQHENAEAADQIEAML